MVTYVSMIGLQFTFYETYMHRAKKGMSHAEFEQIEMRENIIGSFLAGGIASAITNPLEAITVNNQTDANFRIGEFVRKEGLWSVCTKGIVPRVAYNSFQSVMFFTFVLELGKYYNVNLVED